jgi:hypothetical protein
LLLHALAPASTHDTPTTGNSSLGLFNSEVVFSFVGRKGPELPVNPAAPFRVAAPAYVFLNNHYCWPLFRPSGSGSNPAAAAAAAGANAALSTPALGGLLGRPGGLAAGQQQQQQQESQQLQQRMVEVAAPRLPPAAQPRQLQVEYLPVEFVPSSDDPALFAKTVTQFYFK